MLQFTNNNNQGTAMRYNVKNEAEYLDYVETMLCYQQEISFVLPKPFVGNRGNVHDNELEQYAKVFDPDREKKHELDVPFDSFRAAHFEISDGHRNIQLETHANADVHLRYYQWLQLLITMTTAQQVEAEFDKVKATREKYVEQLYWISVNKLLRTHKDTFLNRLNKATDRAFTISEEVKRWELVLTDSGTPLGGRDLKLRNAAHAIRTGRRTFRRDAINPEHKADALLQFLQWLKELQANPMADTTTPTKDTEAESEPEDSTVIRDAITNELEPFKKFIQREGEYEKAVNWLCDYFDSKPLQVDNPVFVTSQKRTALAAALGRIYRRIAKTSFQAEYGKAVVQIFRCFQESDLLEKSKGKGFSSTLIFNYMTRNANKHTEN